MAIKPILRMGNPILRQKSEPVAEFNTKSLQILIGDLKDTMAAAQGAGIAAPQIGVLLRVVIFGGKKSCRYPEAELVPYTELVNPEIDFLTIDREEGWEGCLSVPGLRGKVGRIQRILYRGFEPDGKPIERVAEGFHARVVQHECDHLDGVLFPQRIEDLRDFGYEDSLSI